MDTDLTTLPIPNKSLYSALQELKVIDKKLLDECFLQSEDVKKSLIDVLVTRDAISDTSLGKIIADILKMPYVDLLDIAIDSKLTTLIPEEYARQNKLIAFAESDTQLKVAITHLFNRDLIQKFIEQKAQKKVIFYFTTERNLEKSLKLYKQNLQRSYDSLLHEQVKLVGISGDADAPIVKITDTLMEYAYDNNASDIHLEPEKEESVVRFRIDGVLHEVLHFSNEIHTQIISRIKFLSKLRTDEHLSAQDGKIQVRIENEDLDIRVSIVPTINGEKCVLRLLSERYRQFGLSDLGMSEADLQKITLASSKPFGMILATGPTGSGKTTTIYSILKILNSRERNIATIEDPVEYEIDGLNQIQVNAKTNLTFAEGLRSILRQDPNVIYVGEIRDNETADIAVNSAMTGHLVLSTLHTNDAATTLPRLLDMNIEPFLIVSTVNSIIAQRLVRKICQKCKVSHTVKVSELQKNFDKKMIKKYFSTTADLLLYKGKGCLVCNNTGYRGRIGIFEVLVLSEKIKQLVIEKNSPQKIIDTAVHEGMTTLLEDGLSKVQQGITTVEEILRATSQ